MRLFAILLVVALIPPSSGRAQDVVTVACPGGLTATYSGTQAVVSCPASATISTPPSLIYTS